MNFAALDPTVDNLRNSHFDSFVLHPHQTNKLPVLVPFKVSSPVAEDNVQPIQIKDIYVPFRSSVPKQHDLFKDKPQIVDPLPEKYPLPLIYNRNSLPQLQQPQPQPQQNQSQFYLYASPKSSSTHEFSESAYYDLNDDGSRVDAISRTTTPIPYANNNASLTPKAETRETSSKFLSVKKHGKKSPGTPNSSLQRKTSPELLRSPSFNSPKNIQSSKDKLMTSPDALAAANILTKSSSNTNLSLASYQVKESKKYQCRICEKCFTTSGHLARHTRIHTGERKHVCPFEGCNSRFARHDNCMQHYRTHISNGKRKKKTKTNLPSTSVH